MAKRRVVITGMGTVNPLAHDVDTFWKKLLAGESGIKAIARFDTSDYPSRIGGEMTRNAKEKILHLNSRAMKLIFFFRDPHLWDISHIWSITA